ncbi:septum formation initiator family protein [Pyrinomonas sp.]|uniref:FtsB family cell division protein n=1 Tax=Pyrinomonas sp. TaxID=2080306 RepID=UPI00331B4977
MNRVANTYWNDQRLIAQRPLQRSLTAPSLGATVRTQERVRTTQQRFLPSWAFFAMIMLAAFALCVSVNTRTHAELRAATAQHERVRAEVESLREGNAQLRAEIERLRTDPRAVERYARERLNMVRQNEIILPVE